LAELPRIYYLAYSTRRTSIDISCLVGNPQVGVAAALGVPILPSGRNEGRERKLIPAIRKQADRITAVLGLAATLPSSHPIATILSSGLQTTTFTYPAPRIHRRPVRPRKTAVSADLARKSLSPASPVPSKSVLTRHRISNEFVIKLMGTKPLRRSTADAHRPEIVRGQARTFEALLRFYIVA
jgi:hypothetical protein